MPLHRDIHWIGRQWAVTGHGMQLIDQKLKGFFDIEASRLWDEALIESMHAKEWLNAADFDKGLAIARARYQEAPRAMTPPVAAVPVPPMAAVSPLPPVAAPQVARLDEPKPETPKLEKPDPVEPPRATAGPQRPAIATNVSIDPPKPVPPDFAMRFDGRARFVRPWRVWMKR